MKSEITIGIVSVLIILGLAFFIFSSQRSVFTSFALYNDTLGSSASSDENLNGVAATEEDALQAISDSEEIIQEMKEYNLSTVYVNDLLTEARRALEKKNYAGVLNYAEQIKERKEKAFEIYDTFSITKMSLEKYEGRGIDMNESRSLFEMAKTAFYEDRYEEAENLLQETRSSIDSIVSEFSIVKNLRKSALSFIQRDWYYILAVLLVSATVIYFGYKKAESNSTRRKIRRMKAEKIALNGLMKKAQIERFKENKISALTYNLRIKKYREKLAEIDEDLPVLEKNLKRNQKSQRKA